MSGLRTEQPCLLIQGGIQILLCHLGVCITVLLPQPFSWRSCGSAAWQNQKPCCEGCFSSRNCCNLHWIKHSRETIGWAHFVLWGLPGLSVATCPHHWLLAVPEKPLLSRLFQCPLFSSEYTLSCRYKVLSTDFCHISYGPIVEHSKFFTRSF